MRIEITAPLELTVDQEALLDLHSFVNVISAITAQLQALEIVLRDDRALTESVERMRDLRRALGDADTLEGARRLEADVNATVLSIRPRVSESVASLEPKDPARVEAAMIQEAIDGATAVLEVRAREYLERLEAPNRWMSYDPGALRAEIVAVLKAIERNALGRYRIVFDPKDHDAVSYLVALDIRALDGGMISMPAVLHDVMRDLLANARKYTTPGGVIEGRLIDTGQGVTIEVRDNGRGIPEDEIEKVVAFGYHARNTAATRTLGGGFGLTKAYAMTRRFGGRMWIESELGRGTTVICSVPRPTHPIALAPENVGHGRLRSTEP